MENERLNWSREAAPRLPRLSAAGARVMVMVSKMKGNENECFQLSPITGHPKEIMMGVGDGVASVIMLTFTSEPCPHADFYK